MKCRYNREIFQNKENGYCVFAYVTQDNSVPAAARKSHCQGKEIEFTAVGISLPATDTVEVELCGKWSKGKYGLQLLVESYQEILPQSIEGIRGYLSSGMIKGIGVKTAEAITDRFGLQTFDVLDKDPKRLLEVKGITEKKLKAILFSYQDSHAMRDLAAYLTPFKVSQRKIRKIYEAFGKDALDTVKNNPFRLCGISGFGFLTVDSIARANRCRLNDPLRIEGCIHYCFDKEMQEGHLYQDAEKFTASVHKQLNEGFTGEVAVEREICSAVYQLTKQGQLVLEQGVVYPINNYRNEVRTAEILASMLAEKEPANVTIDFLVAEAQKELEILLSEKQAAGVKMVFSNQISILTGGPGTGKTTIQKVLLYVYEKLGGRKAMLVAPTGRASRRMAESTGFRGASTMHSALGLTGDDYSDDETEMEMLDADFIIADEQSMVDMWLAAEFFKRIGKGTRLVLIGDVNQLPSVGPGNVFRELIQFKVIPVTVLDMVFRQADNSRIPMNAHLMLENKTSLEYGTDFVFLQAGSDKEAADIIEQVYSEAVERHGIEQVQILTPYRKRGSASVNLLNERLRDVINPQESGKTEMKVSGTVFRRGDKIIQNRNKDGISNGDIGFIRDIFLDEDGLETAQIEFTDGRSVEYGIEEMEMIEHSYATTIHKSQGSEYPVVIMPWLKMFYKMLRRDILYTGVTRAKTQVVIVGTKAAIAQAIHTTQSERRNTKLGQRVVKKYNGLMGKESGQSPEYEQIAINF